MNFVAVAGMKPNAGRDCAAMIDLMKELTLNFDTNYALEAARHRNHFERKYRNYIICKMSREKLFQKLFLARTKFNFIVGFLRPSHPVI